jgi:hypothetical protein
MIQSTARSPARKVRVLRIWFQITDADSTKPYLVVPVKPEDPIVLSAYRLTQYRAKEKGPSYLCRLFVDGTIQCTCPAGPGKSTAFPKPPCKHLSCLEAAGMLNAAALLAVQASAPKHPLDAPNPPTSAAPVSADGKSANLWGAWTVSLHERPSK